MFITSDWQSVWKLFMAFTVNKGHYWQKQWRRERKLAYIQDQKCRFLLFYIPVLHQMIALAHISSSFKTVVLLWTPSLYHRFISTTISQYKQSSLLHNNLRVLPHYPISTRADKNLLAALPAACPTITWEHREGRPALLVWRKGK